MAALENYYHLVAALASQFYQHQIPGHSLNVLSDSIFYDSPAQDCEKFDQWCASQEKEIQRLVDDYKNHRLDRRGGLADEFDSEYSREVNRMSYLLHAHLANNAFLTSMCAMIGENYYDLPATASAAYRSVCRNDFSYVSGAYGILPMAVVGVPACYLDALHCGNRFADAHRAINNNYAAATDSRYVSAVYVRFLDILRQVCEDGERLADRKLPPPATVLDLGVRAVALSLAKPKDPVARSMYGGAMAGNHFALVNLLDWFEDNGQDTSLPRDYLAKCAEITEEQSRGQKKILSQD